MNSIINGSRLLAVALCGLVAAGCDTITDVKSEPATSPPGHTGVLEGTITGGLAPVRGVVLHAGITAVANYTNERIFFGALGQNRTTIDVPFSYPAVPVGTPYNFTVVQHPYGKICSITNPSGAVGDGGPLPLVNCEDDPTIFRYPISVTVAPAVASLPEFTVILTANRDYGVERVQLNGATSYTFQNRGLNPTTSPVASIATTQLFQWTITATYKEDGKEYQCRVVLAAGSNTVGNTGTSAAQAITDVAGSAPVLAPVTRHIQACVFPVEANFKYSAPPNGVDQPMGAGGVTLALRRLGDAEVPAAAVPVTINEFTPGTDRVVLWNLPAYLGAAYDLVVTQQPAGQTCIVRVLNNGAAGAGGLVTGTSLGSVIWLSNPLVNAQFTPNANNIANGISIRCRNNPAPQKQLKGVFRNIDVVTFASAPERRIRNRQILSFFDDGTFLFGSHSSQSGGSGAEYGFYDYDPVLGTLDFNVFLDTSTRTGTIVRVPAYPLPLQSGMTPAHATPVSLSNTPGYAPIPNSTPLRHGPNAVTAPNGGVARATNVTVSTGTPASITMSFTGIPIPDNSTTGNPATGAVAGTTTLSFTEPTQRPGQMTGAWVSDDNRRFWVYDYENTTGFHAGVNGIINVQDGCYIFNDPEASSSYYIRRGGSSGCMTETGNSRYFEYYEAGFAAAVLFAGGFSDPSLELALPGYFARFPGSRAAGDGRPPTMSEYTVSPGTPETLSVYRVVSGVPETPISLRRAEVKLD